MTWRRFLPAVAAVMFFVAATLAFDTPVGTALTYQGVLKQNGVPANGDVADTAFVTASGQGATTTRRLEDASKTGSGPIPVGAACDPSWLPTFGSVPGVGNSVRAVTVFDDGLGGGPALYAGGFVTTAGGAPANFIAKWNGTSWSALGTGMGGINPSVQALTVFDDGLGGGPALYAGGFFESAGSVPANRIAKWNGTSWSALGTGTNGLVSALTVFDDGLGGGPALYAGGFFSAAGGVSASGIAKWNGTSWSALGSVGAVLALTNFDDGLGGGSALYAAGIFNTAGGVPASNIAKWNGTSWSALGTGMDVLVRGLTVFDDGLGGGSALYAGGDFTTAGGVPANRIAKWNGTSWSALGTGMNDIVRALTVFDDGLGGGSALYAGGAFTTAGGVPANRIAKWNGTSWSALGTGMEAPVFALTVFDDGLGGGPALCAGGDFTTAGGASVNFIAKWNGTSWSALGTGMNGLVSALTVFDDGLGSGPALHAGGFFSAAGGVTLNYIAKRTGTSWSALGTGMDSILNALTVFNDGGGGGPALYAGGFFTAAGGVPANRIAKWNGTIWSALGTGMDNQVLALTGIDDGGVGGPALYTGGDFTTAGGVPANRIAKWNGASWSALGSGMDSSVRALTVFDDGLGGGPALYAAGDFTTAGGLPRNRIAKWNGASWSALGTGMNGTVYALGVFDDGLGGGPALYAGGGFNMAGGVPANLIAKWNGTTWSALGTGMDNLVMALTGFDDGGVGGPALYAGGFFTTAGGGPANRIAKWNGTSWSALGSGMSGGAQPRVQALRVFDDGGAGGPALYAGGLFTTAIDSGDSYLAKWGCVAAGSPFDPPNETPAAGEPVTNTVGDLDGEGTVDTAVVIPAAGPLLAAGQVQVFRNLGNDVLGEWQGLAANPPIKVGNTPSGVVSDLFNNDPHLDLAVTNAGDDNVYVLLNQGNGDASFFLFAVVPVGNAPSAITSADHNEDSLVDLAVTNKLDNTVLILFGDGFGNFAPAAAAAPIVVGALPVTMSSGDFDNNKCPDLAGASQGAAASGQGGTVFVLLGQLGGGFLGPFFYDIGLDPTDVATGDLDLDGFNDVVVTNGGDNTLSILLNLGNGSFAPAMTVPVGTHPLSVDAFDLENDGDLDLAVVAEVGGVRVVQLLENLLDGGKVLVFAEPFAVDVGADANFVVQADFNGDGFADLVTVNADQGQTDGSVTVLITDPVCPWDCGDQDGVVGVVDFLGVLSQWGQAGGSCDFDGGGTGVTDFLDVLAHWGPCP